MYITINENRSQKASFSAYAGKNTPDAIEVDCVAPSKYHKLKTDYQDFSGQEQWELDATAENSEKLAKARFTQLEILDACKSIDTANGNTVFMDKLKSVLNNSDEFQLYWNAAPLIDLAHPITAAALTSFTADEINNLKLEA